MILNNWLYSEEIFINKKCRMAMTLPVFWFKIISSYYLIKNLKIKLIEVNYESKFEKGQIACKSFQEPYVKTKINPIPMLSISGW